MHLNNRQECIIAGIFNEGSVGSISLPSLLSIIKIDFFIVQL